MFIKIESIWIYAIALQLELGTRQSICRRNLDREAVEIGRDLEGSVRGVVSWLRSMAEVAREGRIFHICKYVAVWVCCWVHCQVNLVLPRASEKFRRVRRAGPPTLFSCHVFLLSCRLEENSFALVFHSTSCQLHAHYKPSKFSDMTTNFSSHPYDTKATVEQPWLNSKC